MRSLLAGLVVALSVPAGPIVGGLVCGALGLPVPGLAATAVFVPSVLATIALGILTATLIERGA